MAEHDWLERKQFGDSTVFWRDVRHGRNRLFVMSFGR